MKKIVLLVLVMLHLSAFSQYTDQMVQSYVEKHKDLVTKLMHEYSIPASILFAQAIEATNAGGNDLAIAANNHFGILCPEGYEGEKYYRPISATQCYKKYNSVEESYKDHLLLLSNNRKCATLFTLKSTNYIDWAHGIQNATNPASQSYARNLVYIIEKHNLSQHDQEVRYKKREQVVEQKPLEEIETKPVLAEYIQVEVKQEPAEIEIKPIVIEQEPVVVKKQELVVIESKPIEVIKAAPIMAENKLIELQQETVELEQKRIEIKQELVVIEPKPIEPKQEPVMEKPKPVEPKPEPVKMIESGIEVTIENPNKSKPVSNELDTVKVVIMTAEQAGEKILIFKAKDFEYRPAKSTYILEKVYINNNIKFIIAKAGDTYSKLSKSLQITEEKLRRYNDAAIDMELVPGEVVYIQPKSKKSNIVNHRISEGETIRYIAQKYAIPIEILFERNGYSINEFSVGNVICVSCNKR